MASPLRGYSTFRSSAPETATNADGPVIPGRSTSLAPQTYNVSMADDLLKDTGYSWSAAEGQFRGEAIPTQATPSRISLARSLPSDGAVTPNTAGNDRHKASGQASS
ncbi:uncharacterized protein N7503_001432 [Penicillium pulvis]|uniref:uncharacterized protein n=1 Tax=Penicillium pulvis TaxID=1562058 RepID=UPI0025466AEF|nr:uncharacterized protein N7503_001432 [Penicillium pulvis]KAJ5809214.1 hypothetical protein N7503_001432 [Penicillium pulvis]